MRLFINAGFGEPIGASTLEWIRHAGFDGVRQDVPSQALAASLCAEFSSTPLTPIFLVGGGQMGLEEPGTHPDVLAELAYHVAIEAQRLGLFDRAQPAAIELGNEPNVDGERYADAPDVFARFVREGAARIRAVSPRAVVVSGGISNIDRRGLEYLERAIRSGFPDECVIGYHSYRTTTTPETPHEGFDTRGEEFARLTQLAGGRPIWCTECGWHTAPSTVRSGLFGLRRRQVRFTDEQVADFFEREAALHARHGADVFAWFQLNDGGDPRHHEDAFGIRRASGEVKPVGIRVARVAAAIARRKPPNQ